MTTPVETEAAPISPETAKRIIELRSSVRETFGKAVMALMMVGRYRAQSLADLQHLLVEPLLRDRIAIAYPRKADGPVDRDMVGLAIWASVSPEVDATIRQQIKDGVFPIRLKSEDWTSGEIYWLFDVIAQDPKAVAAVIANFRTVAKASELRLHPLITRLLDAETLEKLGARKKPEPSAPA